MIENFERRDAASVYSVFGSVSGELGDWHAFSASEYARRWSRRTRKNRFYYTCKRALDIIVVVLALPFVLPLCSLVAVAIKIDSPGPVLFRDMRTGRNGHRFKMLKFRSMVENAQNLKEDLMHINKYGNRDFKISDDPRTTRIGRLLRRSSADELPQLWNVLVGEMSLIGPRACSIPSELYSSEQTSRLTVLPGISGLAQIYARGKEFSVRCHFDAWYVENRSMLLDLRLLFQTIVMVFTRPNGE